ncbi:MAG: hypothetical protein LBP87_13165 [Planctomycetaceae bacterium]|jgi:hypothetical protein|nr:hypothetical protein [Planctomycetaceae bacterium]
MAKNQWHPGFCGAMKLELNKYHHVLEFKDEHQITKGPLRVDMLVIKKRKNVVIDKNIARIFRNYNIIEYKSPDDTFDISDYYKTQGYKLFYASLKKIDIDDLLVTLVTSQHPYNLLKYLSSRYKVTSDQQGIYVIERDTESTQIIVSSELPESENLWLTHLNKKLTTDHVEHLLTEAAKHGKDVALDSYLDVVSEANIKLFQEAFMKGYFKQCLIKSGYAEMWRTEGIAEGELKGITKGEIKGKVEGKAEMIVRILSRRLKPPSELLQKRICSVHDITKLDELADFALTCVSLDEFATALE